jgi:predicted short-subunit dehydrogenase-like oxidoreductase (DUF2520 family)
MPLLKKSQRSMTGGRTRSHDKTTRQPTVTIVGTGSLASFLAPALKKAGFGIAEIISRDLPNSRRRANALAAEVGARSGTTATAALDASLLWLCVPDREISTTAAALASRMVSGHKNQNKALCAFHSSGALLSRELDLLRDAGIAVASVHPLMTFVAGAHPSLAGAPFAVEGDARAVRVARQIVRVLGGSSFKLAVSRKAAYHAWATMTSPLLLAFLVTMEEAARSAGLTRQEARRKSLPIIRQTLANYLRLGPAKSFSGPLIRGDVATVAKHLSVLATHPEAREVYVALARAATRQLPVKNRKQMRSLLQ